MERRASSPSLSRTVATSEFEMICNVTIDGTEYRLELDREAGGWRCRVDGREIQMDAVLVQPDVLSVLIEGKVYEIRRERVEPGLRIWIGERSYAAELRDPRSLRNRKLRADHGKGARKLVAPMPGKISPVLWWREFSRGSWTGSGSSRSDEDAERDQVTQEGDGGEAGGCRGRCGKCRGCAGGRGVEAVAARIT